jgi:8-oxo-dGTP pyrophosphatase MutT (NUDIX family)
MMKKSKHDSLPKLRAAGAVCYCWEGKHLCFLLLRSAKHAEWGAPKGHAEVGETETETAARELYEEAGVRRVSFEPDFREILRYNVIKKGQTYEKETVYFLCRFDPEQVRLSHEHTEAHLASIEEVETLIPHEGMREVFRKALARIAGRA